MKNLFEKNRLFCLMVAVALWGCSGKTSEHGGSVLTKTDDAPLTYILPSPQTDGKVSVEKALQERRSQRRFQDRAISAEQLSQILWAAYGVTEPRTDRAFLRGGLRTAPSAGALYPFEIYAVVGKVKDIEPGVYKYISEEHKLVRTIDRDVRAELRAAALGQAMVEEAPATVVYSAIFSRMTEKYGDRGRERYVCMDLGHSAQNVYLQAEALRLGTCAIGAFVDNRISQVLQLPQEEEPLYLMPVGHYERR
ncbi:MAG: SagB/ThcOx family dehydrogenase [Bacteroidales bacterium]|nr:SagB/ThcOx family dehydrogenase [Bacteroidales bacterium]